MEKMSDKKKALWAIALLSICVILPFLGETIFYSKGEPREAIVAVSILESGNWMLPLNYGTDIAYKPPFLYWCIASISWLFGGEVTEWAARLPSALAFLAMQFCFFWFVAKRKDVKTAVLTSILLLTSFEVHRAAVACRVDMLQVSLIVISLCLLFHWDERQSKGIPWLAVLLMAGATLTKGPVGSIFPCTCIGLYQLLRGRSFGKTFFSLLIIGLLTLIPYAIWIYLAAQEGGEAFINLMLEENTGRFSGNMSYASHENPLWYNFMTITWGWVPWTLVLLLSLFDLKWKEMQFLPEGTSWLQRLRNGWTRFRQLPPLKLFTWVVILFIFVFYCIPKSKRSVYLLPIYPFMALLIAEYLWARVQQGAKVFRLCARIFAGLGVLLTLVFVVVRLGWLPDSIWGNGRHAAENIAFVQALETTPYSIGKWFLIALPLVAAICTFRIIRQRGMTHHLLWAIAGVMLSIFMALDGVYQPTVLGVKSDKRLAACFAEFVPEGPIYSYTDRLIRFYCANYYLNDRMRNFMLEHPEGSGYVVLSVKDNERFLEDCRAAYELEEVYHTPYRSCDLRAEILIYKFKKK